MSELLFGQRARYTIKKMAETKRMRQVAELIKRNFGIVLQSQGPYIYGVKAFVTVTEVKMSPDFGIARIYLSVFNIDVRLKVILQQIGFSKEVIVIM